MFISIQPVMKERIKEIRKSNKLSQIEFAKLMGVSQSVVSLIESGQSSLSLDLLHRISKHFNVSADWVIFGQENYVQVSENNNFIPLVDKEAVAGYISEYANPEFISSLKMYRIPGFDNGDLRIFNTEGDSMEPSLSDGDHIICEKVTDKEGIEPGLIYVLLTKAGVKVRRLQKDLNHSGDWYIQSDNSLYRDEKVDLDSVYEFWWVRSKLTQRFADYNTQHNQRLNRLEDELSQLQEKLSFLSSK